MTFFSCNNFNDFSMYGKKKHTFKIPLYFQVFQNHEDTGKLGEFWVHHVDFNVHNINHIWFGLVDYYEKKNLVQIEISNWQETTIKAPMLRCLLKLN